MRKEAVGKRGSELFPESMNEFLHCMNIALKEKRSVTFPDYYKKIDTFYDIVVKASDNVVESVYLLVIIDVYKRQGIYVPR